MNAIANHLLGLPTLVIVPLVFGLLLHIRWPRIGITVVWTMVFVLIGLSLPLTAHQLMRGLEIYPPLSKTATAPDAPGAIVILGGGRQGHAPEYDADTVNRYALERVRYGARLHRLTGLPILVTGGSGSAVLAPEGELMRAVLMQEFGVPVKWVDGASRTTLDNAHYAQRLLAQAGIRRVYLVTHAYHMRRAVLAFASAGVDVVPAGLGYSNPDPESTGYAGYIPNAHALVKSSHALHEYFGYHWYRYRLARGGPDLGPHERHGSRK